MVKRPLFPPLPRGRPPRAPETLRSARIGLRIHPDLHAALVERALQEGLPLSLSVEKSLIRVLNAEAGTQVFDGLGRRLQPRRTPRR